MLAPLLLLVVSAAPPPLEQARAHMAQLDYRAADAVLRQLSTAPALQRDDVLALYELSGLVAASLGDEDAARASFVRLLALRPEHRLAGSPPPRVTRPFQDAQAALATQGPLRLEVRGVEHTGAFDAVEVWVRGASAEDLVRAQVSCETPTGARLEHDVALQRGGGRAPCQGTLLYVRARGLTARGWALAELGAGARPLRLVVGEAPALVTPPPPVPAVAVAAPAPRVTGAPAPPLPAPTYPGVAGLDAAQAKQRLLDIDAELSALPNGWGAGNVLLAVFGSLLAGALVPAVPLILVGLQKTVVLAVGIGCAVGGVAGIVMAAVGVANGTRMERTTRETRYERSRERAALEAHLLRLGGAPSSAVPLTWSPLASWAF